MGNKGQQHQVLGHGRLVWDPFLGQLFADNLSFTYRWDIHRSLPSALALHVESTRLSLGVDSAAVKPSITIEHVNQPCRSIPS
jgi:hypothetical protein